ncbi:hypothetical protein ABES23_06105 [Peribacillus frigoritolerans]|uniref:hypothetical protein n=1 Tax=Peribacillus frigoritolerans TaxID=450367 RepID=UPI003D2B3DD2
MAVIGIIALLAGVAFIVLALIALIKRDVRRAWKRIGIGFVLPIVGGIMLANSSTAADVKEKEAAIEVASQQAAKDEFETKKAKFVELSVSLEESTNGIVQAVDIEDSGEFYTAKVFVRESNWATSNESEKKSFATSMKNAVMTYAVEAGLGDKEKQFFLDIYSFENGDIVVSENAFKGGFDIKR